MTRQVNLEEAQSHLLDLVEAAKHGETVIIAQDNHPVVQLTRVTPIKRHAQFGSATGLVIMAKDFDAPLSDFHDNRCCGDCDMDQAQR